MCACMSVYLQLYTTYTRTCAYVTASYISTSLNLHGKSFISHMHYRCSHLPDYVNMLYIITLIDDSHIKPFLHKLPLAT